jgi:hypothetical protein
MAAAEDTQRPAGVHDILGKLVRERQELRRHGADKVVLEANRLAIVYWHQRLTRALIAERQPASR